MLNRAFTVLAFTLAFMTALSLVSCKTESVDPDEAPEFELSGSLEVGGTTYNLKDWVQGPFSFSSLGNGLSVSFTQDGTGSFTMFVQNITESQLISTHDLGNGGENGGQINLVVNGNPKVGVLTTGTLTITKNEDFENPMTGTEIRLLSGSFSFSGVTTTGENFSASGNFANAQTTFQ